MIKINLAKQPEMVEVIISSLLTSRGPQLKVIMIKTNLAKHSEKISSSKQSQGVVIPILTKVDQGFKQLKFDDDRHNDNDDNWNGKEENWHAS